MGKRSHGVNPKFKVGDILFISRKADRAGAAATFTVTHREYDRRFHCWFYRDDTGPLYAQGLLTLAAKKGTSNA